MCSTSLVQNSSTDSSCPSSVHQSATSQHCPKNSHFSICSRACRCPCLENSPDSPSSSLSPWPARVSLDAAFETLPPSPNLDAAFGALAERFRSRPTFQSFVTRSSQSVNIHGFVADCILFLYTALSEPCTGPQPSTRQDLVPRLVVRGEL